MSIEQFWRKICGKQKEKREEEKKTADKRLSLNTKNVQAQKNQREVKLYTEIIE